MFSLTERVTFNFGKGIFVFLPMVPRFNYSDIRVMANQRVSKGLMLGCSKFYRLQNVV